MTYLCLWQKYFLNFFSDATKHSKHQRDLLNKLFTDILNFDSKKVNFVVLSPMRSKKKAFKGFIMHILRMKLYLKFFFS